MPWPTREGLPASLGFFLCACTIVPDPSKKRFPRASAQLKRKTRSRAASQSGGRKEGPEDPFPFKRQCSSLRRRQGGSIRSHGRQTGTPFRTLKEKKRDKAP